MGKSASKIKRQKAQNSSTTISKQNNRNKRNSVTKLFTRSTKTSKPSIISNNHKSRDSPINTNKDTNSKSISPSLSSNVITSNKHKTQVIHNKNDEMKEIEEVTSLSDDDNDADKTRNDHIATDDDNNNNMMINNTVSRSRKRRERRKKLKIWNNINNEDITSLSDDDEEAMDDVTSLTMEQRDQMKHDGYCIMDDPLRNEEIVNAVKGYIRENCTKYGMIPELIKQIIFYYGSRFNCDIYIELISGGLCPQYFLVSKVNIGLSIFLSNAMEIRGNKIEINQVPGDTLQHVLKYLGHHKGIEPDPLPCPVRSIHMNQIVTDQWDAVFMDGFDKKTVFEIILAANYMDIKCLLHLGCAKIATLIKALDQTEINRIIEEEEKYRREHAVNDNDDNNDDGDGDDGDDGINDGEIEQK